MAHLIWKGTIYNQNDFSETTLPENAVKMKKAETMKSLRVKTFAIAIPLIILIPIIFYYFFSSLPSDSAMSYFIGIIVSCLFILFGNFMFLFLYPKNTIIQISFLSPNFTFITHPISPLTKKRVLLINLAPCIFIFLILILVFVPVFHINVRLFLFSFLTIQIPLFSRKSYEVFTILKQVPKGAYIQNLGFQSYWFTLSQKETDV
ncbi:hypothetical protein RBG61_06955 [Paludicola sp. MB14-C6]|uniref:hypothetical protein n=1 Tax=Paludihabitans sp. MB14-C6 TaxID=3070656 RepID=UPI0027DCB7EF|nr:hypothetical protein [Paludicola sp. MB14-C6]WMJ24400.1 hypothetical protein RBG61_06955 [Paludicola sp. MB14-C6]